MTLAERVVNFQKNGPEFAHAFVGAGLLLQFLVAEPDTEGVDTIETEKGRHRNKKDLAEPVFDGQAVEG